MIDARDHSSHSSAIDAKKPSIRLHLEEFATECGWDHLYVYDGDSVESPLLAVFRLVCVTTMSELNKNTKVVPNILLEVLAKMSHNEHQSKFFLYIVYVF